VHENQFLVCANNKVLKKKCDKYFPECGVLWNDSDLICWSIFLTAAHAVAYGEKQNTVIWKNVLQRRWPIRLPVKSINWDKLRLVCFIKPKRCLIKISSSWQGRIHIQPVKLQGAISLIFGSQVSLRFHYCKRDEVYFTTLLWQNNGRQNGLTSRILFSELYKITVNKVTFVGFRGGWKPHLDPPLLCGARLSFLIDHLTTMRCRRRSFAIGYLLSNSLLFCSQLLWKATNRKLFRIWKSRYAFLKRFFPLVEYGFCVDHGVLVGRYCYCSVYLHNLRILFSKVKKKIVLLL